MLSAGRGAAATLAGRQHDFAILKTFGAARRQLAWALVGRACAAFGLVAAGFAMLIGSLAALAIDARVMGDAVRLLARSGACGRRSWPWR